MRLVTIITFLFFSLLSVQKVQSQPTSTNKTANVQMLFPMLNAQTLAGTKLSFPESVKGKKTFLILAFEEKGEYENCQKQAELWAGVWVEKLKDQGIAFYEIPMMSGKYWWVSYWVDSGMRSGIAKEKHDNVACFYGDKEKYTKLLAIKDLSQAYVFLLDENGYIIAAASGEPDETKINSIQEKLN
jgi:hypothetical protein